MKFVVEDALFDRLPSVCFGVVVARGVDNALPREEITALWTEELHRARERVAGRRARELPEIAPYREAFTALGINPNKFPCSIEALLTRIEKGKDLPSINPLVDLGNAISLRYTLPIGPTTLARPRGTWRYAFPGRGTALYPSGRAFRSSSTPESRSTPWETR